MIISSVFQYTIITSLLKISLKNFAFLTKERVVSKNDYTENNFIRILIVQVVKYMNLLCIYCNYVPPNMEYNTP